MPICSYNNIIVIRTNVIILDISPVQLYYMIIDVSPVQFVCPGAPQLSILSFLTRVRR